MVLFNPFGTVNYKKIQFLRFQNSFKLLNINNQRINKIFAINLFVETDFSEETESDLKKRYGIDLLAETIMEKPREVNRKFRLSF